MEVLGENSVQRPSGWPCGVSDFFYPAAGFALAYTMTPLSDLPNMYVPTHLAIYSTKVPPVSLEVGSHHCFAAPKAKPRAKASAKGKAKAGENHGDSVPMEPPSKRRKSTDEKVDPEEEKTEVREIVRALGP